MRQFAGDRYWCVKTDLSESGEIYFYADEIEVNSNGDMIGWVKPEEGNDWQGIAIASGNWSVFFAADCFDGHAVEVGHWKGEVVN